jgi:phage/plasmid primase-like uncharacterized protein
LRSEAAAKDIPLPAKIDFNARGVQRYKAHPKDNKKSMRLKVHLDGVPTASILDMRVDDRVPVLKVSCLRPNGMTAASIAAEVEANRAKREAEDAERHAEAARTAQSMLDRSSPADPNHGYLMAKGIPPHGDIRQIGNVLLVRMMRGDELVSLQQIWPDGSKLFLSGTQKQGAYFIIGDLPEAGGIVLICEGLATGLSLYEATGYAVIVAFDCNNLIHVGKAFESAPYEITFASDDDWQTEGNPGRTKAREAALAIGAKLAMPAFGERREKGWTDFNDLGKALGLDAVRECVERAEYVRQESVGNGCANGHAAGHPDDGEEVEAVEADPAALDGDAEDADEDEFADEPESDGTDDTAADRASALRAILLKGEDAKKAEWRIKRQCPHLKDTAAAIVESAQRTAEKWKPGSRHVIDGMLKRITSLDVINERFVMVEVPGQPTCVAQRSDALFLTRDDFRARLGDSEIVTSVNNKGVVNTKPAAQVWLRDCRRRIAKRIIFTSRETKPNEFNLWTGFGVTPKAGICDLIHRHIREVICAGDPVKYEAFINLLAWQVQNIGRASRIMVVLYSKEQQVGKGVLLEKILPEIFGPLHGAFTSEYEHIFGRFNDFIRGKVYAALDEACYAGDRKAADKVKSQAAAETMTIEGKGLPKIQCPVGVNIFLATNHEHAAHVEQGDARYWILKVSPHRKGDVAYWAELLKEIGNGGAAALFTTS